MAVLLDNPVRSYAWGSTTVISHLLGRSTATEPQAELWIGGHPGSSSTIVGTGRPLDQYIADDPVGTLGPRIVERFGARLPFLLKLLAVERPLSVQVHPTIQQAIEGYAAEDAAGVPLDSPRRSYHDRNHKPEMIVALTPFEALLGFADPSHVADVLESCDHPELAGAGPVLRGDGGLEQVVRRWLTLPAALSGRVIQALTEEASARRNEAPFTLVNRLAEVYPGDRGLLVALLMRYLRLDVGEAAHVPAGVPHAYLSGVGIEPQASSENTLRAGLTAKHVDIAEVMRLLRYEPGGGDTVTPVPVADGQWAYVVAGVEEFRLTRLELSDHPADTTGPAVVFMVEGHAELDGITVGRGGAAFVPAADGTVRIGGHGVAFRVTTGPDRAR